MSKVDFQHTTGNGLTLIGFDEVIPNNLLSDTVRIDGTDYKTEIVYDLPNHIAILGEGDFLGTQFSDETTKIRWRTRIRQLEPRRAPRSTRGKCCRRRFA